MAIVTRRYLFQGPSIEDIQAATDPGLTLISAPLKLAFDLTFDDAVATVAAVDAAMADKGYVPDPGADTTVPPTFPDGGFSPTAVITSNQTIAASVVARVDTSGGPVTITLPPAFNNRGLTTIVKDVGGAALLSPITIVPSVTDTIDGASFATISVNKGVISFVSDGASDWLIV